jgi:hypothetical protein
VFLVDLQIASLYSLLKFLQRAERLLSVMRMRMLVVMVVIESALHSHQQQGVHCRQGDKDDTDGPF